MLKLVPAYSGGANCLFVSFVLLSLDGFSCGGLVKAASFVSEMPKSQDDRNRVLA